MGYPHYSSDCFEHWNVVTICGSMRFYNEMLSVAERLTLDGKLVLMPFVRKDKAMDPGNLDVQTQLAREESTGSISDFLDRMHKRKIDLSKGIVVVNPGGYIGDSTRSEIEYAEKNHKTVEYREF